ncbi:hypothetical protein SETIT_2G360900v2 [Setaria italica]|uniref:KIB1-4 beta-propeller domain-containing protein n=2 Tax=Setaria TaxID=4554 RepID=A0A368Q8P4_SETIT|nr:uncharacterized protein LOC105913817 [Setaria italica]XP_034581039.1 uncharacterized protein LOC117844444 [Setaria viridis]RCV13630.1 hypothetical protein SETIT_2G360900v2 [Setaria italica]TKW35434.1 hypothetical protein SEVIR_2G372000v2 [Setaria viridis]
MPCTLSTQRGARPAEETAAKHGWSSLPDDLVIQVGNRLLADSDIYSYMDFRAVCTSWSSATKDNAKPGRFQPSKWALIDRHDDVLTFVSVETGRFVVKNIPLLRRYGFVGATGGGMIILEEPVPPYQVRVLNPFTGLFLRFKASLPIIGWVREATLTTSPVMLFVSSEVGKIMWADLDSEHFQQFGVDSRNTPLSMTPFDGKLYLSDQEGSILSSTVPSGSAQTLSMATTIPSAVGGHPAWYCYLVKSGEELLLVSRPWYEIHGKPVVRKVDTENNKLEVVTSIGNRALYLSDVRCLSVDASKFQGIEGGCIYFVDPVSTAGNGQASLMTTFRVAEQVQDDIIFDVATMAGGSRQPFTLAQVFANYCRFIYRSERGSN